MGKSKPVISYPEFDNVDIRVGTIVRAEVFTEAIKPAYKLWVDFGGLGILKSSAQITQNYTVSELIGKKVCAVVNLGEKQIGPFLSQCLVTGFEDESGNIRLTTVDGHVPNGAKLY